MFSDKEILRFQVAIDDKKKKKEKEEEEQKEELKEMNVIYQLYNCSVFQNSD
jgi:hypothetical protein